MFPWNLQEEIFLFCVFVAETDLGLMDNSIHLTTKQLKFCKYPEWLDMTSLKNHAQLANRPEWCDRSQFYSRILSMN